jgi:hypothetical protein
MDTFDLKKYLAEGQLYENEMDSLGDELADAIEDKLDFGDKYHGKKFGEYEVFAVDDDDRGEIVRIVKSDSIMRG